jgi:hypothetical protein
LLFLSVEGGEVESTITTLCETKTMSKPRISTDESVAGALFAELGKDDDDAAMEILQSGSLDSKGMSTPRTRVSIASAEWDAKDRLIIKFMLKENCWGRIGTAGSAPGGADRFCGKDSCSVAIHKKALVDGEPNQWYIQAGVRSTSGFFCKPSLPSVENGGPIPKTFEARMRDLSRPSFAGLTLGQWRFVFDDWASSRIETLSEEDVENFPSVSAATIKTDTFETSEVSIETEKVASMVINTIVFQALLNIVEALEMDRDNAVVQMGNLRIENIQNVQKASEKLIMD